MAEASESWGHCQYGFQVGAARNYWETLQLEGGAEGSGVGASWRLQSGVAAGSGRKREMLTSCCGSSVTRRGQNRDAVR